MKRAYIAPETEVVRTNVETALLANSKEDQYHIGGDDSKWPEEGPIHDDYGDGPGVSGAKKHNFSDWDD